ncbi:MAG TPA: maleylpyruvate isomerase N-terminal domain-containing protein [Cyclobacteriaceae bacterium]|nr:maleylpyruvate isomerase N-terminal domain-containing protein [Cyclobacteriaceae bacterium]
MIATLHLFEPLEHKLISLLKSLDATDWNKPTVAKLWTVKDVAAHLLDTRVRTIALFKNYAGDSPEAIHSFQALVNYLNRLNADWVKAIPLLKMVAVMG